ncbi:chromosomal replication initiation protein [Mesorhizobium sp. Root554]|uniref:chromosomal replication initiator protein DnaA n=1 Tax=unclassified Mesorhizobium TaxID=325217 RepID=UPI0006FE75D6|nr:MULTISPECIES: chromosomal replication initiator protein DnaA [unclassified Mesorhizobium]KQZ12792.1 chromosomal replication initiation protein [Mesorhizobium sp. Root1471]KQZ35313.1 chromosomal replication initiation protein [Mesorhizobium sp. Root554]
MQSGIDRKLSGDVPFPGNLVGENGMVATTETDLRFERVRTQLKARLGSEVYSSWFGRMKLDEMSKAVVRMSVPTAFLRSWITGHYLDLITELWKQENPDLLKVEIVVRTATRHMRAAEAEATPALKATRQAQTALSSGTLNAAGKQERSVSPRISSPETEFRQSVLGSPLDPRYTFTSFVEGPSNRVAFAAARAVAESATSAVRFNPLFLHATVGLGKTHLLQAIAAESLRNNPRSRVVYLTAEYFMWRFATAIRDNNALTLKEQLRDIDLLIIDDMQFLQGKSIQHEFCHLINMLLDSAKQVVVAADRPPAELESLEPRVRSRLNGGVALEMSAPDFSMRLGMLQMRLATAKVDDTSLDFSEEILNHIARTVTGSGRELEGAFNQLLFRKSFEPQITIDRIDEILGHIYRTGEPKRVRIEDIQRIVARHYNVSKTELLSNRRTRTIVKPRQIAMYLSKVMTPRSLPEIGRRFGGRDHTTVLHAVRKIEDLSGGDNTLAQELELLRRLINEQA